MGFIYFYQKRKKRKEGKQEGRMERRKEGKERGLSEESQLYSREQWEDRLRELFPEPRVPPATVCPCSLSLKGSGTGQRGTRTEQQPPCRNWTL